MAIACMLGLAAVLPAAVPAHAGPPETTASALPRGFKNPHGSILMSTQNMCLTSKGDNVSPTMLDCSGAGTQVWFWDPADMQIKQRLNPSDPASVRCLGVGNIAKHSLAKFGPCHVPGSGGRPDFQKWLPPSHTGAGWLKLHGILPADGEWCLGVDSARHTTDPARRGESQVWLWECRNGDPNHLNWINPINTRYVSLGDSYAAGEGIKPFWPTAGDCRRSESSFYGHFKRLSGVIEPDSRHLACTGAQTQDLLTPQLHDHGGPVQLAGGGLDGTWSQPAQLEHMKRLYGTNWRAPGLVTLSIGGNDLMFGTIMERCFLGTQFEAVGLKGTDDCINTYAAETYARLIALGTDGQENIFWGNVHNKTVGEYKESGRRLSAIYNLVATAAPSARVLVLGYPRIFEAASAYCEVWSLSHGEMLWIDTVIDELNKMIKAEVEIARARVGARLEYVDMTAPFAGGGICPSKVAYDRDHASGVGRPAEEYGRFFWTLEGGIDLGLMNRHRLIHPNYWGQLRYYEHLYSLVMP